MTWAEKVTENDKSFTVVIKKNAKSHKNPPADDPLAPKPNNSEKIDRSEGKVPTHATSRKTGRTTRSSHKANVTMQSQEMKSKHSNPSRYRRFTVLLIHDKNFQNFSPGCFSSQFNVHQFIAPSFRSLNKLSKELDNNVRRLRPDCIYIHLGINDLVESKSCPSGLVHALADQLLKITSAQICFSLLIPSSNNSRLNDRIHLANSEIISNISWFRKSDEKARSRIFTFTNDIVGNQNVYSSNSGFLLSDRGEKMLYLRLREGLKKTMRLPRPSYHIAQQQGRHSTTRDSYD